MFGTLYRWKNMYGYSHLSELSHVWNDIVTSVMKNIFYH